MICRKQPAFLAGRPTLISDVWEVQLQPDLWHRLRMATKQRRTTYSNVTRYCIFRLAEKQNLRWNPLFSNAVKSTKVAGRKEMHRHIVCLYGEDVRLLRLAAMTLGITVSAFVRMALWLYLPRVAMEIRSKRSVSAIELFRLGTKRWIQIPMQALNHHGIPHLRQQLFSNFLPWHWWPSPMLTI